MNTAVTKEIEFDAGHRVPNHNSKCRNPHGHRYKVRATVVGSVLQVAGDSSEGMVVDFGDLKSVMMTRIHDVLDHGFIVYDLDEVMKQALNIPFEFGYESEQTWRVIQLPYVPTAENLALWCFTQLNDVLDLDRFHLDEVTVWETPTSSATYNPHWENL